MRWYKIELFQQELPQTEHKYVEAHSAEDALTVMRFKLSRVNPQQQTIMGQPLRTYETLFYGFGWGKHNFGLHWTVRKGWVGGARP
jgi:hypothetical protein